MVCSCVWPLLRQTFIKVPSLKIPNIISFRLYCNVSYMLFSEHPNSVLNFGCPLDFAVVFNDFRLASEITFIWSSKLWTWAIYHEYGGSLAEKNLVFELCRFSLTYLYGDRFEVPFYTYDDIGSALLENAILMKSTFSGPGKIINIRSSQVNKAFFNHIIS